MYDLFLLFVIIMLYPIGQCHCYGYDSGSYDQNACGSQARSGRLYRPPCDLTGGYCTSAGNGYPWHAVKRFVQENQGLMKRMYGDQRHGQVLRAELNEDFSEKFEDHHLNRKFYAKEQQYDLINNLENELYEARYLRDEDINNDDVLNTKFVYSEEPAISVKLGDLKTAPHFRPTTSTTSTTTTTTPASTTIPTTTTTNEDEITIESTTDTTIQNDGKTLPTPTSTDPIGAQSGTILFQDMEDNKNKVHVNYQMKGVNACPVKEEVVAPFWANNTRGEVLALLNMYPFEQYVHWEKCTHEHRQMYCRDGCRCEQQYRLHRLLAYDPNNECRGIFSDWFRFPSCCICKCYNLSPAEFRVTSRSPRTNHDNRNDNNAADVEAQGLPDWYRRKNRAIFSLDHG